MFTLSTFTGGIAQTNGYLLSLNDQNWVIDAPEGMDQWLRQKGVSVDGLLLTHQHFDHVLDAEAIRISHDCPVFSLEEYSPVLTLETLYGALSGSSFSVTPFRVSDLIDVSKPLTAAGVEWTIFNVPGHSPDSLCFYSADLGLLFGGDVLFRDGVGRTDFPNGSWQQLLSGIKQQLLPLPGTTRVLPGHGPDTTIAREQMENPFLQE